MTATEVGCLPPEGTWRDYSDKYFCVNNLADDIMVGLAKLVNKSSFKTFKPHIKYAQ